MERSIAQQASPRQANPSGRLQGDPSSFFFSRIKPFLSAAVRRSLPVKRIARDERPSCVRPLLTQRGKRRFGPGNVPGSRVSSVQGSRQHMLRDQE